MAVPQDADVLVIAEIGGDSRGLRHHFPFTGRFNVDRLEPYLPNVYHQSIESVHLFVTEERLRELSQPTTSHNDARRKFLRLPQRSDLGPKRQLT
jgi:hypothetical protein